MSSFKNTVAVGLALTAGLTALPVSAQVHKHPAPVHKKHHISPVVAGVAAYEVAKHTGKPGRKNVLQRHPVLTGLGAAYLAHRHNKKHGH